MDASLQLTPSRKSPPRCRWTWPHAPAAVRPLPGRTGAGPGVRTPGLYLRARQYAGFRPHLHADQPAVPQPAVCWATASGPAGQPADGVQRHPVAGVQNDSEKAIANLGYYQVQFLRPVYPGDTLRAFTRVLERKDRGPDKPGIARIRTVGVNQDDKVVLQYERKIMVGWRGDRGRRPRRRRP